MMVLMTNIPYTVDVGDERKRCDISNITTHCLVVDKFDNSSNKAFLFSPNIFQNVALNGYTINLFM